MQAAQPADLVVDEPAWTGLPPGEFIRSTTPCVFFSLNAPCSAAFTLSALALPLASMTPATSTNAVCRSLADLSRQPRSRSATARKVM
jgi:hypothetical protein